MFRWLFLSERGISSTEHSLWRISALRIILVSGFVLEALIAIHSSLDAMAVGAYQVVAIVVLFHLLLTSGLYYSVRRPNLAAGILIVAVYAAGAAITLFVQVDELAKLGIVLVYMTPIIARIFFGGRIALALMLLNVLPFLYLLRNDEFPHYATPNLTLAGSHTYLHSLLFLFFNFTIPLAVFRVLYALDASAIRYRESSSALATSHAQFEEFFEHSGAPTLLCEPDGTILQANRMANELIGRLDDRHADESLFDWLHVKSGGRHEAFENARPVSLENLKGQRLTSHDGRQIQLEYVTRTTQQHYIVVLRDRSALNTIEEALQRSHERETFLSLHDSLTRLPNRQSLLNHLTTAIPMLKDDKVLAMVSIRLNSIRHANEKFGASMGDTLIQSFADELRKILPISAFCARLRSIVFSIVLAPARSPNDLMRQIKQLRDQLPKEIVVDGNSLIVQISTGVALARSFKMAPGELMRSSEVALDSARRANDDSVAIFDEADAIQLHRNVEIELGLVSAIRNHEFRLVYQPKVNSRGQIAGLEALLRWYSPSLGHVSPMEFIPIAENRGLIHDITAYVIEETCAFIRRTIDRGQQCPPIALNLSAIDIIRNDLLDLIDTASKRHATPPELLEFEITETGLIGNEALAVHHLKEINRRGNSIAIDDFGTGYSSFSKLSNFPVSSIKIDQSFVERIGHCAKSELIIKAIISLASILSCISVAEGVETEAQEKFLKSVGCDLFQGYYYYRPLEAAHLNELLNNCPRPEQDRLANSLGNLAISAA